MRRNLGILAFFSIASTILLWFTITAFDSFFGVEIPKKGMDTVLANYDGPLYVVVSKTWYDFTSGNRFEFPLPNEYYAAHFPLYPLAISVLGIALPDYWAALLVTLLGSVGSVWVFYLLSRKYLPEKVSFWMSIVFLFVPARYFVVRSIGSPEPIFLMFIMLSILGFVEKRYWLAGISGALATLTKSPGILLFISFIGYLFVTRASVSNLKKYTPMILIPLALVGLFAFYKLQYNDFWAYFHSGDNIHLMAIPFQVFDSSQPWVGDFWLEEVIWVYILGLFGLVKLIDQKKYEVASFVGVFLVSIFFVSHRDISRYALPIAPFILIAFGDSLAKKEYRWIYWVLIIPIFLYSLNFIANNAMGISDWGLLI